MRYCFFRMSSSSVLRLFQELGNEGPRVRRRTAILALLGAAIPAAARIAKDDDDFLDDLCKRAFRFFLEQTDRSTGLVLDRARTDGARSSNVASIAATG